MNQRHVTSAALLFVLLLGCGKKPPAVNLPKAYAVNGKVVDKQSGEPITAGAVQFESLQSAGQTGIAEIQADGTFSANTFVDGNKLSGLVPGPQRVTFMPSATVDQASAVPVTLSETFEVKESDNDFLIQIDAPPP